MNKFNELCESVLTEGKSKEPWDLSDSMGYSQMEETIDVYDLGGNEVTLYKGDIISTNMMNCGDDIVYVTRYDIRNKRKDQNYIPRYWKGKDQGVDMASM